MRWLPAMTLLGALLWLPESGRLPRAITAAPATTLATGGSGILKVQEKDIKEHPGAKEQGEAALAFLESLPVEQAYYVRLLDWRNVPVKKLTVYKLLMQWWLNQMSTAQAAVYLKDVPGQPHLSWLDISEYRWTHDGWLAVAEREPYDHEPQIPSKVAQRLRELTGQELRKALRDKDRYPVLAMVSADWFFRETIETLRSTAYYDLLFGKERFGKPVPRRQAAREPRQDASGRGDERVLVERGGVLHETTRGEVQAGEVIYVRGADRRLIREGPAGQPAERKETGNKANKNFPEDIGDWDEFFGLDIVRQFGKKRELDLDYGAVVEGGADDPKRGSIVALRNRLLLTEPSAYSIGMRTFDVFETAGEFDYSELAPKIPLLIKNKKVKFKAGELLAYLPNGGQAALLINEETKRIELAVGEAAQNTLEKRMNPGVRVPGDCVACHGPDGGYIMPRNLIKEYHEKGLDAKFKNPLERERFRGFFFEWEERVEPYQKAYNALLARTTRLLHPGATPEERKGWTGTKMVAEFKAARDEYDDPVTTEKAAASVGISVELFRRIAVKSTLNAHGRLQRGIAIPRSVWEKDAYRPFELLRLASE